MARVLLLTWIIGCLALTSLVQCASKRSKSLKTLNEDSWKKVLKGEWMIEFHAPWCPACKDLQKAWNSFADWSKDLEINVAEVDVTTNPGLSGRFLVTALPTIYHVKDGVFRHYSGPRDKEDFISFIEAKKWTVVDPVASWKHPDSPQMAVVAMFFKLSMSVRDLHNHLVEQKGVPAWLSYTIFAGITLFLGCVLGFMIVCVIDMVFPASPPAPKAGKKDAKKDNKKATAQKDNNKKNNKDKQSSQDEGSQQSQTEEDSADESTVRNRTQGKDKSDKNAKGESNEHKKKK